MDCSTLICNSAHFTTTNTTTILYFATASSSSSCIIPTLHLTSCPDSYKCNSTTTTVGQSFYQDNQSAKHVLYLYLLYISLLYYIICTSFLLPHLYSISLISCFILYTHTPTHKHTHLIVFSLLFVFIIYNYSLSLSLVIMYKSIIKKHDRQTFRRENFVVCCLFAFPLRLALDTHTHTQPCMTGTAKFFHSTLRCSSSCCTLENALF